MWNMYARVIDWTSHLIEKRRMKSERMMYIYKENESVFLQFDLHQFNLSACASVYSCIWRCEQKIDLFARHIDEGRLGWKGGPEVRAVCLRRLVAVMDGQCTSCGEVFGAMTLRMHLVPWLLGHRGVSCSRFTQSLRGNLVLPLASVLHSLVFFAGSSRKPMLQSRTKHPEGSSWGSNQRSRIEGIYLRHHGRQRQPQSTFTNCTNDRASQAHPYFCT